MKDTETLFIRLNSELKTLCVNEAEKSGLSLNAFIIMLLLEYQREMKNS